MNADVSDVDISYIDEKQKKNRRKLQSFKLMKSRLIDDEDAFPQQFSN